MKNLRYSTTSKTIAMILQMFFLMFIVVTISLFATLFERSMLSLQDIGNDSFFHSLYFRDTVQKQTNELVEYLQLMKSDGQMAEKSSELKQYKLEFGNKNTNYRYWVLLDGKIYTNMNIKVSEQDLPSAGKRMGSYIYYDETSLELGGNITNMKQYLLTRITHLFKDSNGDGKLLVGVDPTLSIDDEYLQGAEIYDRYIPWVRVLLVLLVFSVAGLLLSLIRITLSAGRTDKDDDIHLMMIDRLPTEGILVLYGIYLSLLISFCTNVSRINFEISGLLILSGTLVFMSDLVTITLYLSITRKIKDGKFFSDSIIYWGYQTFQDMHKNRLRAIRSFLVYVAYQIIVVFSAWEAMVKNHAWAIVLLVFCLVFGGLYWMRKTGYHRKLLNGIDHISSGELEYKLNESEFTGEDREMALKINQIGQGLSAAVDSNLKNERMKTELLANVSHDIKTPLTSIINYVNLIKMEKLTDEKVINYVDVLEKKSQRLKRLIEDLVEVSKLSSGNITLDMNPIDMVEFVYQTAGEFVEIFETRGLTIITKLPQGSVMIMADGNKTWRIIQNLYNNVAKYAMPDTRVYVELKVVEEQAVFSIKDVSEQELVTMPQDLGERFVRGDESRTTEGSGLGLSIARSLVVLMGGDFQINVEGDMFTVTLTFPLIKA